MASSLELDELATALAAAQAEFTAIPKDSNNPFFKSKYAGLPTVVAVASPILNKHGLSVSQFPSHVEGRDALTTFLLHSSGQFIEHSMLLHLPKDDPQGQGSALTYARRYSYMAALGLVADDDDDGNRATEAGRRVATQKEHIEEVRQTVQESRPQEKKIVGNKIDVTSDQRWAKIEEAAKADPSNTFLTDLVKKGKEYGTLSEKQLGSGFNAATKVLQSPAAKTTQRVADAFGASSDPF